jgi:hypothetical protein
MFLSHVPEDTSHFELTLAATFAKASSMMTPIQPSSLLFDTAPEIQPHIPSSMDEVASHFASSAAQNAKIRMLIGFTSQTNSQISALTREGGGASQESQLEDGHTLSESSSELVVLTTFVRSGHGVETVPVLRLSSFSVFEAPLRSHT